MSATTVNEILLSKLDLEWADRTPIYWDDTKYTPVNGTPFIQPLISGVFSETKSARCQREWYLFTIEVSTPELQAGLTNLTYVDALKSIFLGFSSGNLVCRKIRSERSGGLQGWYQTIVSVEAYYDNFY